MALRTAALSVTAFRSLINPALKAEYASVNGTFVDVTAYLSGKLAALGAHASQVEMSAMVEPDAVVASARHWGAQARIGYAEAFAPTRMVIDLMPTPRRADAEVPEAYRLTLSASLAATTR